MKNRHVQKIDFYVYDCTAEEAREVAENIAKEIRDKYDNKAAVCK